MQLQFLPAGDGRRISRSHIRRACALCRQRKKRCYHNKSSASPEQLTEVEPGSSRGGRAHSGSIPQPHTEQEQEQEQEQPGPSTASNQNVDPNPFLCDTSPIVTLLSDPRSRLKKGQSQKGIVGASLHHTRFLRESTTESLYPSPRFFAAARSEETEGSNIGILPPKSSQKALVDIYFRRLHPFLPLLDEDETRSQFANGTLSVPLLQSMCLAASKSRDAAPFLCLGTDMTVLPVEIFGQRIYADVPNNMPKKEEKRILTIRILALLSLHGWGPSGHEDSSLILSQAIHHAQTFGLHLAWPEKTSKSLVALFWCLWGLDQWNCAVNGRPPMINDYDTGQDVADVLPLFQPSFQIWLRIASQLGGVIKSYRPVMDGYCEPDAEIPIFEEVVEDSLGFGVHPDILESLELFHHAVVILSTHAKSLQGRSRSRMTKIRQSQSLFSVATLVRKQITRDSPPLSIFAYTISIAFSVTYRQLKGAKLPSAEPVAIDHLDLFHQSLKALSDIWWLAAVMTHLSKAALDGIHRQRVQADHNIPESQAGTDEGRLRGPRPQTPAIDTHTSNPTTAPLPKASSTCGSQGDASSQSQDRSAGSVMDAEPFAAYIPSPFGGSVLSLDDEAYFDSLFENFPSLNFPNVLGEPFLADQAFPLAL